MWSVGINKTDLLKKVSVLISLFVIFLPQYNGCTTSDPYPAGDFNILIVSDTHFSRDESKVERLQKLSDMLDQEVLPNIRFIVNTGDVVSRVYGDYRPHNPDTTENRLQAAVQVFQGLSVPYYFVMGNHDYKIGPDRDSDTYFPKDEIELMEKIWKKETGFDPYYSFHYEGWNFIILNSMRGRYLHRHFDDIQLQWFEQQLKNNLPAVLFFHHPLETDHFRLWAKPKDLITDENERYFYGILEKHKDKIKAIFVGHGHRWVQDTLFGKIQVLETPSFGDEQKIVYTIAGFFKDSATVVIAKNPLPVYESLVSESIR